MKRRQLRRIFEKFTKLNVCYADGGESAETDIENLDSGVEDQGLENESPAEENAAPGSLNEYLGSENVNPDQRPLRPVDRSMFSSKEQFDKYILEAGDDAFLSDEEIAEMQKDGDKEDGDKEKDEKSSEDKKEKDDKEDDKEKGTEEETKAFFDKVGVTAEEFDALPLKIQERLAEGYSKDVEESTKVSEVEKQYTELKATIEAFEKDPVIAARLEEHATGRQYTARDLPMPTDQEIEQLMDAAVDEKDFKKSLVEFMVSKADQVIKVERSVVEQKAAVEQLNKDVSKVVSEMIEKEKRLGITEKDFSKINEQHPEYEAWKGEQGLYGFFKKNNFTLAQIRDMGSDKLLTLLSNERGWDKERDKKIHQQGAKALLAKINEAKSKARTIDMGKRSALPKPGGALGGYDSDSLVAEIASGSLGTWERLLEKADQSGDTKMLGELFSIREKAQAEHQKKNTPAVY